MLVDEATFSLLKRTIQKEGWLDLPATGNSMFPLIHHGNICRFIHCDSSSIQKGDIILFYSDSDQLIAHRFVERKSSQAGTFFLFKGDTNLGYDHPVENGRILGRLASIQKKHMKFTPDDFGARMWSSLILKTPVFSAILRNYLNWQIKY